VEVTGMNALLELMSKALHRIGDSQPVFYTNAITSELHERCGTRRAVIMWRFAHLQWFRCTGCAVIFSVSAVDAPHVPFEGIPIRSRHGQASRGAPPQTEAEASTEAEAEVITAGRTPFGPQLTASIENYLKRTGRR